MTQHKNILFLIADDLGKYVGCYGCKSVNTPNLDRLASQGVKFDLAFASTASCSGSRSTIYTGLHTHENGQYGLNIYRHHFQTFPHVETAPKLFIAAGYKTGIIGKVHVGTNDVYPWEHRQESDTRDVAWVADQVDAFCESAKKEDRPFYLTVGFVDPHRDITTRGGFGNEDGFDKRVSSINLKPEDVEVPSWLTDLPETRQELVEYYKAVHRTDCGVGMILDALEKQGLAESTLVIFTSDNGPPFINAKTTLYDAGTCLPLLVRQPGGKAGITNPNMISYIDFLPTFLDWAGIKIESHGEVVVQPSGGFDTGKKPTPPLRRGRSFLPIMQREDIVPESDWQHHVFGSHTFHELQNYWPTRVLRTRRYKYHRNIAWRLDFPFASDLYASYSFEGMRNASKDKPMIGSRSLKSYLFRPAEELFDLENDPEEINNLAEDPAHKELLLQFREQLEQWQKDTKDMWLYRDSTSLLMMSRYATYGMEIPDRFDMDPEALGTEGLKMHRVVNLNKQKA